MYLGATKDLWLTFDGRNQSLVNGFCDTNWASQTHCHSISGYLFHMESDVVTWSSKKQYIVVLSSTELEYIVISHTAKEALWLQAFILEIRAVKQEHVIINCNNQGAIALSKDNKYYMQTKHIDIWYHFICKNIAAGNVIVDYIPSSENTSNILTKALPKVKYGQFVTSLGLQLGKGL